MINIRLTHGDSVDSVSTTILSVVDDDLFHSNSIIKVEFPVSVNCVSSVRTTSTTGDKLNVN